MGKTDERKENRQQWYKSETNRRMERAGRAKVRRNLYAGLGGLLLMTAAVKYVQAIELGGFDVDMGTGSFEGDVSDWNYGTEEEVPSGEYNYEGSNDNQNENDISWDAGEDYGEGTSGIGNNEQSEQEWDDFFSAGQHEEEISNNSYDDVYLQDYRTEETMSEDNSYIEESADATETPSPKPVTVSVSPFPSLSGNILEAPEKEEELPEEECRQKMQIIYCRKEINKASKIKIYPNPELAAAILSIRINGKEADWYTVSGSVVLNVKNMQNDIKLEIAVMCCQELSWTEIKKNAILTYNIL